MTEPRRTILSRRNIAPPVTSPPHPTLFLQHEIAGVNGAMQVEERDCDGDGRLDFVALISQEHESLVLFRNDGNGRFESEVLDRAPHPACGPS